MRAKKQNRTTQDGEDVCFPKSHIAPTVEAPISCDIGKHRKASTLLLRRDVMSWGHAVLGFPHARAMDQTQR